MGSLVILILVLGSLFILFLVMAIATAAYQAGLSHKDDNDD